MEEEKFESEVTGTEPAEATEEVTATEGDQEVTEGDQEVTEEVTDEVTEGGEEDSEEVL